MRKLALMAATLCALAGGASAAVTPDVVYGADDRLDLYQVQNQKVLGLADSTVGLFQASNVSLGAGGRATLSLESYAESYNLCKEEPFFDQKVGAFCSGSLVAPDVIMTAGHCVRSQEACKGTKFVFGFAIKRAGQMPDTVAASDVYGCAQLLGREEIGTGADWALVRLDKPVRDHKPLQLSRAGDPQKGTPMFVIGHPAGLPTKVAGGAIVRDPSPSGYFVANLDTYGGNSGSAVFNARGLVEGILVRGENDYVWRGGCRVSNTCAADDCRGEDVTKVSAVLPNLPRPGRPFPALKLVSSESIGAALDRIGAGL